MIAGRRGGAGRRRRPASTALLVALVIAGCGNPERPPDAAPVDAAVDAPVDAPPTDAAVDAPVDAVPIDGAPDARIDAAVDGGPLGCTPPSILDPSFGGDGWVDVPGDSVPTVAVSASGQVLACARDSAAGASLLSRFDTDGSPDLAFGTGGQVDLGALPCGDLTVLVDGRIAMATNRSASQAAAIALIGPAGQFDAGTDVVALAGASSTSSTLRLRRSEDGDGTLAVLGVADGAAAVWRLTAAATPSSPFGSGGMVTIAGAPGAITVWSARVQLTVDDQLYELDATTGVEITHSPLGFPDAHDVRGGPGGGVFVLGAGSDWVGIRTPDPIFARVFPPTQGPAAPPPRMAIDPLGRILIRSRGFRQYLVLTRQIWIMAALTSEELLDPTFGPSGTATVPLPIDACGAGACQGVGGDLAPAPGGTVILSAQLCGLPGPVECTALIARIRSQ